ncbi:MAG: 3-deoxy-7-phosphoheptulonate synthase [Parachlamydiaceae bacterium]|nr:3-deoxy-7-phosphoheptulonate synthase [Parachlamydiaceae bacterium]
MPLLFPSQLLEVMPLLPDYQNFVTESRGTIQNILTGKDPRLLLIVGPCSIHDLDSAVEYANRLKSLSQSISDSFFLVMRVYFEKPRTSTGWKGFSVDPHLDGSMDIRAGHFLTRQLLLHLAHLNIPVAAEFLEPTSSLYFGDLVSWGCIGARTTESQLHRQMASGLPMPVGFKNNTSGNVEAAINGIATASQPHTYMGINKEGTLSIVETEGNPKCHLVLRGGNEKPNYDSISIAIALDSLKRANLPVHLLVDCSHDNSFRSHENQSIVFESVIDQVLQGNKNIRGVSLESHLNEGKQAFPECYSKLQYGVSLTDSCIGWELTEQLAEWGASALRKSGIEVLLLLLLCLSSCCTHEGLTVFSEYVLREELASYHVGTPDPRLNYPDVGQKIYINWKASAEYINQKLTIKLYLRFRDRTENTETINLEEPKGRYVFSLLNEEFFARQGILSYKIEFLANDVVIDEWRHQLWVNLITFPD